MMAVVSTSWVYRTTLQRADWLAYETMPRELSGWRRWHVFGIAIVFGMIWSGVEDRVLGADAGKAVRFAVIFALCLLAFVLSTIILSLDQKRRIDAHVLSGEEIEIAGDGTKLTRQRGADVKSWTYAEVQRATFLPTQIFIEAPGETLILPLRCFGTEEAMREFFASLDAAMDAADES